MNFFSILAGMAASFAFWFIASYFVAYSFVWVEHRYPQLSGSKQMRTGEVIMCGAVVIVGIAIGIGVASLLWMEPKG